MQSAETDARNKRRPSMKRIVLALSLVSFFVATAVAEEPFSKLSFEKACKKAGEGKKIVMIDFYTTWCGPCKMLDKSTWKDERVIKWLSENTIPLKIDAEKEADLAAKYKIRGYPTMIFIKPDGTTIDSLVGYRPPEQFLADAKAALAGKDGVARAKEQLEGDSKSDPMKRGQYAKALAQKGKYKEALEEYLWCFDHGNEHNMGYGGVRLSFLLSDIAVLGEDYPPAIKAMEKRRDAAKVRLFPEDPDAADPQKRFSAAMEFASLNQYLNKSSQTLEVFDLLKREGDSGALIRKAMFHHLDDLLLKKKRYGDFVESDRFAIDAVDQSISRYNMSVSMSSLQSKEQRDDMNKMMKRHVIDEGAKYYEAAVGLDKGKLATRIARKLVKFDPGVDTFRSLIKHAQRTGKTDAVQALLTMAEKDLDANDFKSLKEQSEKSASSGD
jgi:thioredoxin 1